MVNVKLLKEQIISFNYFNYFFGFKYHRQSFSTQYCSNWVQENKIFDKDNFKKKIFFYLPKIILYKYYGDNLIKKKKNNFHFLGKKKEICRKVRRNRGLTIKIMLNKKYDDNKTIIASKKVIKNFYNFLKSEIYSGLISYNNSNFFKKSSIYTKKKFIREFFFFSLIIKNFFTSKDYVNVKKRGVMDQNQHLQEINRAFDLFWEQRINLVFKKSCHLFFIKSDVATSDSSIQTNFCKQKNAQDISMCLNLGLVSNYFPEKITRLSGIYPKISLFKKENLNLFFSILRSSKKPLLNEYGCII